MKTAYISLDLGDSAIFQVVESDDLEDAVEDCGECAASLLSSRGGHKVADMAVCAEIGQFYTEDDGPGGAQSICFVQNNAAVQASTMRRLLDLAKTDAPDLVAEIEASLHFYLKDV